MTNIAPIFVSHGAPTLALDPGQAGAMLAKLGSEMPRPRAILVASAHWESAQPRISAAERPETIHDFRGFPRELYELRYPAPGAPELAQRATALLRNAGIAADVDAERGLDHGAWVPLRYLFPQADVPVTQISIQPRDGARGAFAVGGALAPLASEGVLLLGSGSLTHNLYELAREAVDAPAPDWVRDFVSWMRSAIEAGDTERLLRYRELAPHAQRNHPTDEHLLPLFWAFGAAQRPGNLMPGGVTFGVLAMDAFRFDGPSTPNRAAA